MKSEACVVIPARLNSERLPGKLLRELGGRPVLWHVWARATRAGVGPVLILSDSAEIIAAAEDWGGTTVRSTTNCRCGTERIAMTLSDLPCEFLINVQGDQPLVSPEAIQSVASAGLLLGHRLVTAAFPILDSSSLANPSIVKMLRSASGDAFSFSRNAVPFVRGIEMDHWVTRHRFWGHTGIYGYSRAILKTYLEWDPPEAELAESLEQLRFCANGHLFHVVDTESTPAIETELDFAEVQARFNTSGSFAE